MQKKLLDKEELKKNLAEKREQIAEKREEINEKIAEKVEVVEDTLRKKPSVVKVVCLTLFVLLFVGVAIYFFYEFRMGHFKNVDSLSDYVSSYGVAAPIMLAVFQCVKVTYAIIPGALGCIVGAQMFGPLGGFICSYVGICLGSMISFMLSRRYGVEIMRFIFSKKRYDKSVRWLERHRGGYSLVLWIAIFFPFSPDDFLCYFSGLTNISFRRFALIILTAKPWTILAYSLIFGGIF